MEDIRDVLEMLEPTAEVIASLNQHDTYIVLLKGGTLTHAHLCRYKTVAPKFEETCRYPSRFVVEDVKYIFKKK